MKKQITILLFSLGVLAFSALPVLAQANDQSVKSGQTNSLLNQSEWRFRDWRRAEARPGHPITLEGQGTVVAHGKGRVHYQVDNGGATFVGKGVVAYRNTDQVSVKGWDGHMKVGEWTFYWGKGAMHIKGNNSQISGWGRFRTRAHGQGRVTFHNWWNIRYHGRNESSNHPEDPIQLPDQIKSEAGSEAMVD